MIDAASRPGVHQEVGRLSDLRMGGSSYGTVIPQVWGATKVPGIVVWSTDLQESQHTHSAGGKGLGGGPSTTSYTYSASFACYVARGGRNIQINRIWADDLILWDQAQPNTNVNFRFYSGSETQAKDTLIASLLPKTPAYRGTAYVVFQDLQLQNFSNHIPNIQFEISTDLVTVGSVMSDIAAQTPLQPADIDVSRATTPVAGYQLNSRAAAKDAVAQLLTIYLYDNVEVDGVLRLLPRGGAACCQIAADEIGAALEAGTGKDGIVPGVLTIRAQEIEMPQIVEVVYFSGAKNFEQMTQRAIKQVAKTPNILTLATTLTLDDTTAKQLAYTQLYNRWLERTTYVYSVLPKYRYLTPGDVVQLPVGDAQTLTRMRIGSMQIGLPGEVKLTCFLDDAGPLTQFQAGTVGTIVNGSAGMFGMPVPSDFAAWSGAELRAVDQAAAGFYVAAAGGPGWTGGEVWYSSDSGATYSDAGRIGQASAFGTCTTTLQSYAGGAAQDAASTLGVTILDGKQLTSTSDAAAALGANAAVVIGPSGAGEIVTFATATLSAPGAYTLSRFYRGQRGSAASGHGAGEKFILAGSGIIRIGLPASLVGSSVQVKVVSMFQQLSDVAAQTITIRPRTPTAVEQNLTSLQAQVNAIPPPNPVPFYRVTGYIEDGRGPGDHIDATYFGSGVNVPLGKTQFNYTEFAGGPGGSVNRFNTLDWALHYRIGLNNTGSAAVTVHYFVPYVDNFVGIVWNGVSVFSKATNDGSISNNAGTFVVAAGQTGILDLFYFNEQSSPVTDNGANPGPLVVLLDALDQAGMQFYDAGP